MAGPIRRHPLVAFFLLAYLGSWLCWSPMLFEHALGLPKAAAGLVNLVGLFAGPFAAALIVTRVADGTDGIRRFWRRMVRGGSVWWWVTSLLVLPVVIIGCYLATTADRSGVAPVRAVIHLLVMLVVCFISAPLQEEPGWRGFAFPRMQRSLGPLVAALLVGVLHGLWHLPLFFTSSWSTPKDDIGQFFGFLLLCVGLSVVMGWVVNTTRFSILLPMLLHTGINFSEQASIVLVGHPLPQIWPAALVLTGCAVVALAVTRGRLGYRPENDVEWAGRPALPDPAPVPAAAR